MIKRSNNVRKQMNMIKKLVSQKQQNEIDLRTDFEQIGDALAKQVESKLSVQDENKDNTYNLSRKKGSSLKVGALNTPKKKIKEITQPLRNQKLKKNSDRMEHNSGAFRDLSPRSNRSIGSDNIAASLRSPRGSNYENQLRLDLIDEEENIDEMLKGTHNFWSKDVERNE